MMHEISLHLMNKIDHHRLMIAGSCAIGLSLSYGYWKY